MKNIRARGGQRRKILDSIMRYGAETKHHATIFKSLLIATAGGP